MDKPRMFWQCKELFVLTCGMLVTLSAGVCCLAADWTEDDTSPPTPNSTSSSMPSSLSQQNSVPGPPLQRQEGSRPASWPGTPVDTSWVSKSTQPIAGADLIPCEDARIVAKVGTEAILECDVKSEIHQMIQTWLDREKRSVSAEEIEAEKQKWGRNPAMMKQAIRSCVQTKLIYLDAKKTIPSEGWPQVEKQMNKHFEESGLPAMMKRMKVTTRAELDKKLKEQGSSLERETRLFLERALAMSWASQKVKPSEETTYDQLVGYYQGHLSEFTSPPRVQWEELKVSFSKYHNDKAAAYDAIAKMGNAVWSGVPFAEVAKTGSDGSTSINGGFVSWTNKGSQTCKALDEALFTMRVGELSPIIESATGFHIVRVLEREDTAVAPFLEAQVDIQAKIVQQRADKQRQDYIAGLEAKTPVWTMYDGDIAHPQVSSRTSTQR